MLSKVKAALRISKSTFDGELTDLIEACLADLRLVGIPVESAAAAALDALLTRSVLLYAKANFGFDDSAERYKQAYDAQKLSLSLATGYGVAVEVV